MNYYIGIDGGGTKTRGVLTDDRLNIISVAETGSSNLLSDGIKNSAVTIFNLIKNLLLRVESGEINVDAIGIGVAGGGRKEQALQLKNELAELLKSVNAAGNIFVSSDAHITIEAAFGGSPGMILIAGTGSVVFGKDESGRIHRSGGYGKMIGDEGSAYSIGRKALSLIAKELDGIISGSGITKLFVEKFGEMNTDRFINLIHSDGFDIAQTSIIAIKAAENGDAHAVKIISEEAELLCAQVNSVFQKLNGMVPGLCFHGGLITNNKFYSDILKEKIMRINPQIKIKEPDYPPEIGAVIMAKNNKEISGVYSK